jgi:hypothetical protein
MVKKKEKKSLVFQWAWIAGVVIIGLSILQSILENIFVSFSFMAVVNLVFTSIQILGVFIFTYAFYRLGRKYNSKFLRIISIILIALTILGSLLLIFYIDPIGDSIVNKVRDTSQSLGINVASMTSEQEQLFGAALLEDENLMQQIYTFLGIIAAFFIFLSLFSILFGIALLGIRKKVKYAKIAGILEIIGGFTLIIFVGFILMLVAFVFEIIILKREADS